MPAEIRKRKTNPLRLDPTRTTMLRRAFLADMARRFAKLRSEIRRLVSEEDAFGLRPQNHPAPVAGGFQDIMRGTAPMTANTRFAFATNDKKIDGYRAWLTQQTDAGILETTATGEPWTHKYIQPAYKKGMVRAYTDTKKLAGPNFDFIEGGQKAFMDMSFGGPVSQGKLKTLATRNFTQLKGITTEMDKQMSEALANGLAAGHGADELARNLEKTVTGLEKKRARAIARTEVIHAHAEGELDSFEAMNVEEVGVMAEWSTAADAVVCELCAPIEGVILTIKEARGMIPRHPNCRCSWIPASIGEHKGGTTTTTWSGPEQDLAPPGTLPTGKTTGQVFSKEQIGGRILQSIKREHPKLPAGAARKASQWVGADVKVRGKLKPGSKKWLEAKAAQKTDDGWGIVGGMSNDVEEAVLIRPDGYVLKGTLVKGDGLEVGADPRVFKTDGHFISLHTHPKDVSFSAGDYIAFSDQLGVDTIAIKLPNGQYHAATLQGSRKELWKRAKELDTEIKQRYMDQYLASKVTKAEANQLILKHQIDISKALHKEGLIHFKVYSNIDEFRAGILPSGITPAPAAKATERAAAKAAKAAERAAARKAAQEAATAKKLLHSEKVKAGMAKKKYGLADSDVMQLDDDTSPFLTYTGLDNYIAKHKVSLTAGEIDSIMAAKPLAPGTPKLVAQMEKLHEIIDPKIATAKWAEEAVDATAVKVGKWKSAPGVSADVLDNADYAVVPGWGAPTGSKSQSYGVVIFDDQGRVLLREPTGHFGGTHWTFAKGGGTKPGTTALAELAEEMGHKGVIYDVIPGEFKGTTTKTNYFIGKSGGYDAGLMDAETMGTKWMTYDEAVAAISQSADPVVVARDLKVLEAAYATAQGSDGTLIKALVADGKAKYVAAQEAAKKAAHSHKVKLGLAQKHYAKEKFGGGVTPDDWVNPANPTKLNTDGLDKVLGEKGWHTTTLQPQTAAALAEADDVVAQKAILDGLKKAPKGTPKPPQMVKAADDWAVPPIGDEYFWTDNADELLNEYGWINQNTIKGALADFGYDEKQIKAMLDLIDETNVDGAYEQIEALGKYAAANKPAKMPVVRMQIDLPDVDGTFIVPAERDLTKIKDLPGSTRPYLAKDTSGKKWVVKDVGGSGIKPDHLRSEALADELYRVMGFDVPAGVVRDTPSGPMKITEFLEGGQTLAEWKVGKSSTEVKMMYDQIKEGFVADALLANHDVAGMSMDNIFVVAGKAYRIDNGGALTYRAQGGVKSTWGAKVTELVSMRDRGVNANTAAIYKGLTKADIELQIRKVVTHRTQILAAIPDAEVRATMAARLDDLQAQLPATAARKAAPAGALRAEYGVTPATPQRTKAARSNGVTIAGDRDDIEDTNILVWGEVGQSGREQTRLQFKATQKGSANIESALGDDLRRADTIAQGAGVVSHTHPADNYWAAVEAGAKTIGVHATDGQYNMGTVTNMLNAKTHIVTKLKAAVGDEKKMLQHYKKGIEQLEAAMAAGKELPKGTVTPYVYTPPKTAPAATQTRRRFNVRRDREVSFTTAKFKDGVGRVNVGVNRFTADTYTIDADEGIVIKFIPRRDDSYTSKTGRTLHGTVSVTVPEGVDQASINKALAVVRELGLDTTPPTSAYEEVLYIHRGVHLQKKSDVASYKRLWKSDIPDEEKVVAMKKWVKDEMGVDLDNAPYYDPAGVGKHADGGGYRHWYRWDMSAEDVEREMGDYVVQHTTKGLYDSKDGAVAELVAGVLDSGGEFTSTTGRIRKGVSVSRTGGGTSGDAMDTGGNSYLFTRIKKAESVEARGFFFKPSVLARQDAVSLPGDRFGRLEAWDERGSTFADFRRVAKNKDNECLFKEGHSLNDLEFIRVRPHEVQDVVDAFESRGVVALPDGRPIRDIVISDRQKVPKKRVYR